jgi:hypothetical protein
MAASFVVRVGPEQGVVGCDVSLIVELGEHLACRLATHLREKGLRLELGLIVREVGEDHFDYRSSGMPACTWGPPIGAMLNGGGEANERAAAEAD